MKVIVCGGRDYDCKEFVYMVLNTADQESKITVIVQGGADGADMLAREWAHENGVQIVTYHANWDFHGKKAGPIRNEEMAKSGAIGLIAFPGGRGTADMVRRAKAHKLHVAEFTQ